MGEFLPFWLTSESMYEVHIVTAKKRISMVMPAGQPTHATELGRPSTPAPMMAVMTCPLACHQFPDATTATTWLQMRGVFLQQLARHTPSSMRECEKLRMRPSTAHASAFPLPDHPPRTQPSARCTQAHPVHQPTLHLSLPV